MGIRAALTIESDLHIDFRADGAGTWYKGPYSAIPTVNGLTLRFGAVSI